MEKWKELSVLVQAVLGFCGLEISGPTAELIAIVLFFSSLAVTTGLIAHRALLWLRRRMGDTRAISDEQLAVVKLIKFDIDGIKRTVNHIGSSLNENFQTHIQTLSTQIGEVAQGVVAVDEVEASDERRSVRMFFAEQVREAVMERFEGGRAFKELPEQRHVYVFDAVSAGGARYVMKLATPYRKVYVDDGRNDYVLEVRVDSKKAFVFQWDVEGGRPHSLFLSQSREWIDDIKGWNFAPNGRQERPVLEAAE